MRATRADHGWETRSARRRWRVRQRRRFHPLPLDESNCYPPDGHGRLCYRGGALTTRSAAPHPSCSPFPQHARLPACPPHDQRNVEYGLLGPRARSVTFAGASGKRTEPILDREGVYLNVEDVTITNASEVSPSPPTIAATYAGGRTYTIAGHGTAPLLPADREPGRVAPQMPTRRAVRAPIRVRRRGRGRHAAFIISFRAPIATRTYRQQYVIAFRPLPHAAGPRCTRTFTFNGFNTYRDLHRGALVSRTITPGIALRYTEGWCPGTYHGYVYFIRRSRVVGRFLWRIR